MPKNIQADIDWHKARIAFYRQALDQLITNNDGPDAEARRARLAGLRTIIADLERTQADLEKVLERLAPKRP